MRKVHRIAAGLLFTLFSAACVLGTAEEGSHPPPPEETTEEAQDALEEQILLQEFEEAVPDPSERIGEAQDPIGAALIVICKLSAGLVTHHVCEKHSAYWKSEGPGLHCPEHTNKLIHHIGPWRMWNVRDHKYVTIPGNQIWVSCDTLRLVTCGVGGFGASRAICGGF